MEIPICTIYQIFSRCYCVDVEFLRYIYKKKSSQLNRSKGVLMYILSLQFLYFENILDKKLTWEEVLNNFNRGDEEVFSNLTKGR